MSNPRSSRRKIFVLVLAGVAALVLAGFVVGDWPVLVARYHAWRIQEAETYEAAHPWLEDFQATAKNHHAASTLVDGFRPGRARLMTWFFAWLERTEKPEPVLMEAFEKRLRRDETLLADWSHYVRWRRGPELWSYLSALSPQTSAEAEGARDGRLTAFPCSTEIGGSLSRIPIQTMIVNDEAAEKSSIQARLSTLGIAWFVGMWPLPEGDNPELALASWMQALKPFSRQALYDEKLRRCLRDTERAPLPELDGFIAKDAPTPQEPVHAWQGTAPTLPEPSRAQTQIMRQILPPDQAQELYDINWPKEPTETDAEESRESPK